MILVWWDFVNEEANDVVDVVNSTAKTW